MKLTLTQPLSLTILLSLCSNWPPNFLFTASIVSTFSAFPWYFASCGSTESFSSRSPTFMFINQELVLRFCIWRIIWRSSFLGPPYLCLPGVTGHYIVLVSLLLCLDAFFLGGGGSVQHWPFLLFPTQYCWRIYDSILCLLQSWEGIIYYEGLQISPVPELLLHPRLSLSVIISLVFLPVYFLNRISDLITLTCWAPYFPKSVWPIVVSNFS